MGVGGSDMAIEDNRYMIEREEVSAATESVIESLKDIEHGGIDVIKDAVTTAVNDVDSTFSYTEIWDKVFRHVLVRLENEHQLAHILMI